MTAAPLTATVVADLTRHSPFDAMGAEDLEWLAQRLSLAYHPKGETILSPEQGEVDRLFIIKQGVVQGEQAGQGGAWLELHEGEVFPLGALLSRRAVISTFRAVTDVFCYELAATDFHALLARSAPFHDFCTRRIAALLERSQRGVQAQYATGLKPDLDAPLAALMRRAPVTCSADTPLRQALQTMHTAQVGSIVVVDAQRRPQGVFTVRDLIGRVLLPERPLDTPIGAVMTPDPVTLPVEGRAFEAALAMARHGFRHVLLTEGGRLAGVVSEQDLFTLQRVGVTQLSAAIRAATDLDALQRAAADILRLGHSMMAQGVAPEQLTQILTTLNDLLSERLIELEYAAAGTPPVRLCWLAFGSEGRHEQTLASDQDNGIVFLPAAGASSAAVRERLLPLAERINRALDACGFPLCKGGVMAMNPKWCLSLDEWKQRFADWIDAGSPEALLNASIFFDFRPLWGEVDLATELRRWLLAKTAATPRFLHQMAANALRNRPPLGLVRDFVLPTAGEHAHTLDLKLNGSTPFVDAARVWALASGVEATRTVERLRAAGPRLHIPAAEIEAWVAAFHFIQQLRLRHQHACYEAGRPLDNHIDPDRLNDLDRRILKEAFRQARKLQARLAMDYQL
ncbi:MAG: putative nucleotidyltransferase substrate binding domain-containing protein [Burkholderiales bacterium]|nr:putative nucleotidyltransferase substrate binding domain-containing protein [Burkholderiales bacterium]